VFLSVEKCDAPFEVAKKACQLQASPAAEKSFKEIRLFISFGGNQNV
jgi:hypothetical protein